MIKDKTKIGDLVTIKESCFPYFKKYDVCKLVEIDDDGLWWGDFNNQGNKEVHGNGVWCIGEESTFELINM